MNSEIVLFFQVFLAIFIIMDVIGNIPLFWSLSQGMKPKDRLKSINTAIFVATALLLIFLFLGNQILYFFGIGMSSFRIAGGILLFILGIEMVLGLGFKEKRIKKYEFAAVPLATPLITGPGVITTVIIWSGTAGIWLTFIAACLNLLIVYLGLRYSEKLHNILGKQGADVLGKIMGLILCAIAVEMIRFGILG